MPDMPMQAAILGVEKWANKWGFKLSVAKTQVICFSRRHKIAPISLKLYEQPLEQVKAIRFLGVWFDEKFRTSVKRSLIYSVVCRDRSGEQVEHRY